MPLKRMHTLNAKSKALALVASGKTLAAAGRQIGVAKSTVHDWVVASGLVARRTKPRIPAETKRTAVELVAAGLSMQQVSRRCGISWDSISRLVNQCNTELARSVAKPVRCGCGALVTIVPCIACQARKRNGSPSKNSNADSMLPHSVGSVLRMYSAA